VNHQDIRAAIERSKQRDKLEAERPARHAEWVAAFTCLDPTGAAAPCAGREGLYVPGWETGEYARRYRCPIASAKGCEPYQHEQTREARAREAEGRARLMDRKIHRRIPSRFMAASLAGEQTPAVRAVRRYLKEDADVGRALVLLGVVGCGKTWALCGTVDAWPRSALFLEADAIARAAARDHDQLDALRKAAESVSLLALDDLFRGYSKSGGLAESVIEELLCHRHGREMATIITSNLTPEQLSKRLSPRVVDRFKEWATIVVLPAGSLRVQS
jgi:DNA replication protein DnaC